MNAMNRRAFLAMMAGGVALVGGARAVAAHGDEGTPAAGATPNAMPMGGTAAAFMTITNGGSADDRLVSAKTDVTQMVEIHEMKDKNGVMEMSPLPDGLPIPAGTTVELKPGGYHVMLFGLKHDLVAGEQYQLTVTFEHAGDVTLDVPIFASLSAFEAADKVEPVTAGDLKIEGIWTRMAPAMTDGATPASGATPTH